MVWGQGKHMDRLGGAPTVHCCSSPGCTLACRWHTFTERMMAYCDQVFQDETGKNR